MKVMLVVGTVIGGGTERQWMLLARALLDAGHAVTLATLFDEPTDELRELLARGLRWRLVSGPRFRAGTGRPMIRTAGLFTATTRLRWLIERERPDIVYSALTVTNALAWCATRGGRGDRLVWGIRGEVAPNLRFEHQIERVFAWMAPSVPLAITNASRSIEVHERLGIHPKSWATVPNGFDVEMFRPDPAKRARARAGWGVGDDALVIGCMARYTPEKQHAMLIRAFAKVRAQVPTAVLVLVGAAVEPVVAGLVRDLVLVDAVRFPGAVDDVATAYAGLDLHVLASSAEGLPNAIGEAMACGVPCVGTDVGDVAALIGDTGIVVPSLDEDALAKAMIALLTDPGRRHALGDAARRRIVDTYAPATAAARTIAAFAR